MKREAAWRWAIAALGLSLIVLDYVNNAIIGSYFDAHAIFDDHGLTIVPTYAFGLAGVALCIGGAVAASTGHRHRVGAGAPAGRPATRPSRGVWDWATVAIGVAAIVFAWVSAASIHAYAAAHEGFHDPDLHLWPSVVSGLIGVVLCVGGGISVGSRRRAWISTDVQRRGEARHGLSHDPGAIQ